MSKVHAPRFREVVVTGLGAVTPLGSDVETTWSNLLSGRSGAQAIDEHWAADLPVRFAAAATAPTATAYTPAQLRRMDRGTQLALLAAQEAWADASLDVAESVDPERLSVSVSAMVGVHTLFTANEAMQEKSWKHISPYAIPAMIPNMPAAEIASATAPREALTLP